MFARWTLYRSLSWLRVQYIATAPRTVSTTRCCRLRAVIATAIKPPRDANQPASAVHQANQAQAEAPSESKGLHPRPVFNVQHDSGNPAREGTGIRSPNRGIQSLPLAC